MGVEVLSGSLILLTEACWPACTCFGVRLYLPKRRNAGGIHRGDVGEILKTLKRGVDSHGESRHTSRCHSAFLLPGSQNRTKEETREGSPSSISEAGRITPLALNIKMRASEPEE